MRTVLALCTLLGFAHSADAAAISLSGPSTSGWISLGPNYDYLSDQQTGDPASDIVGNAANPGVFTCFDDLGTPSLTDGFLGFRVRLDAPGGNANNIQFGRNLWVGIDADSNGSVDMFLGINLQGSAERIGIFAPGSGANTSPSTTTISNTAFKIYAITAENYNYRPVNHLTDGGTTNDLTTTSTGDPDYYVSFLVPFADVVAFLNQKANPVSIHQNSPLRYVIATSTQSNSLNQDLGGVNGGVNSTSTWEALGGFSPTMGATGTAVPEPSAALLGLLGCAVGAAFRRR